MPKIPPNVNGVMELTNEQIATIRTDMQAIQANFEPTEEEPILSTHGLVSRYNNAHPGAEINGDTAENILK